MTEKATKKAETELRVITQNTGPSLDTRHLWFELSRRSQWSHLVIVPADDDVAVLPLAFELAAMAKLSQKDGTLLINLTSEVLPDRPAPCEILQAPPGSDTDVLRGFVPQVMARLKKADAEGTRVLVATDCPVTQTAAVPLIRVMDTAVLAVALGNTRIEQARRTVEIIERDRLLGSVIVKRRSG